MDLIVTCSLLFFTTLISLSTSDNLAYYLAYSLRTAMKCNAGYDLDKPIIAFSPSMFMSAMAVARRNQNAFHCIDSKVYPDFKAYDKRTWKFCVLGVCNSGGYCRCPMFISGDNCDTYTRKCWLIYCMLLCKNVPNLVCFCDPQFYGKHVQTGMFWYDEGLEPYYRPPPPNFKDDPSLPEYLRIIAEITSDLDSYQINMEGYQGYKDKINLGPFNGSLPPPLRIPTTLITKLITTRQYNTDYSSFGGHISRIIWKSGKPTEQVQPHISRDTTKVLTPTQLYFNKSDRVELTSEKNSKIKTISNELEKEGVCGSSCTTKQLNTKESILLNITSKIPEFEEEPGPFTIPENPRIEIEYGITETKRNKKIKSTVFPTLKEITSNNKINTTKIFISKEITTKNKISTIQTFNPKEITTEGKTTTREVSGSIDLTTKRKTTTREVFNPTDMTTKGKTATREVFSPIDMTSESEANTWEAKTLQSPTISSERPLYTFGERWPSGKLIKQNCIKLVKGGGTSITNEEFSFEVNYEQTISTEMSETENLETGIFDIDVNETPEETETDTEGMIINADY